PQGVYSCTGWCVPVMLIADCRTGVRTPCVIIGVVGVGLPQCWYKALRVAQVRWHTVNDPPFRAVRIHCTDEMTTRVIVYRHFLAKLPVRRTRIVPASGEERLVLLNHTALVVVGLPTTHHDMRRSRWVT